MGFVVELRGRALSRIFKKQKTLRTVHHEGILIFKCLYRVIIAVLIEGVSELTLQS